MRRPIWVQITAVAALLGRVCAQLDSLPPCGVSCVNSVIAKGFGCASGDNTCLCKQQDFVFGVRDCASQSCGADEAPKINDYVTGLCATATQVLPVSTPPAPSPSPSTPAEPQTTPPPAPSSTLQPSSPPATTVQTSAGETRASSEPPKSLPSEASSKGVSEAAEATQLPTTTPTTLSTSIKSVSSTVSKSTTSTSTGARASQSGSTSDAGAEQLTNDADGLSVPAKAGIGAAAGVGVLAIALALWLLIRRPRNQARSLQISGPMPGSGRDYTGGFVGMVQKNNSELELRSRRYEDMVPRQSPRHVI